MPSESSGTSESEDPYALCAPENSPPIEIDDLHLKEQLLEAIQQIEHLKAQNLSLETEIFELVEVKDIFALVNEELSKEVLELEEKLKGQLHAFNLAEQLKLKDREIEELKKKNDELKFNMVFYIIGFFIFLFLQLFERFQI